MKSLRDCPKVLFRKVLFTALIGVGCLLVGAAYFFFSGDGTTLYLSAAIFIFSAARAATLYRIVCREAYEVVTGICVGVRGRVLRKHQRVKVMDDAGLETTLRLAKNAKVKIGTRYRFYFTKTEKLSLGSEYLDAALSSGAFLGYEDLGDYMEPQGSQIPAQPSADDVRDLDEGQP